MDLLFVEKHYKLIRFALSIANMSINRNQKSIHGGGNTINEGAVLKKKTKIKIAGANNAIEIGDYTRLIEARITILGNNNTVIIGNRCFLKEMNIYIEDDNNRITIGDHVSIDGSTEIAAIEGTYIEVGDDCMFSRNIHLRTGDSHSIVDLDGNRINKSKSIYIGRHSWIGTGVSMLKGSAVKDNTIVGANALVTKAFNNGSCVIAGVPAKIIKTDVSWTRERI